MQTDAAHDAIDRPAGQAIAHGVTAWMAGP